jgi:hypothetical protein
MKATSLFLVAAGFVVACGGSATSSPEGNPGAGEPTPAPGSTGTPTPAPTPAPDHGAVSTKFPAFAPEVGQVVNNGGPVLAQPVITTVTWPNDPNVDKYEQFADQLGPTDFWKATTSEYGVGPALSDATHHVRLTTEAPAMISDTELSDFVAKQVGDVNSGWPAPVGDAVYILYLSSATSLMLQGSDACSQGVGGYHDSTVVNGKPVAYAIVPQCGGSVGETTLSASHELVEAATDPYPQTQPAYVGFDDNHAAWDFFQQFQDETGDACEFYRDSTMSSTSSFPFVVQRQWSNASAKAGHDPCVPAAHGTYFNVTPLELEQIDLDLSALGGGKTKSKGYKVPVGQTKTIPLGFYSDGPMADWTIKAVEGGAMGTSQKGRVTLTLDKTTGQNGQKAFLTIKANVQGKTKAELISIVSTSNGVSHYMPILVGSP